MLSHRHANHQHRRTRPMLCGLSIASLIIALTGCAADQQTSTMDDASAVNAQQPSRPSSPSTSRGGQSSGDDLADHIQRDVDAFLAMRDQADDGNQNESDDVQFKAEPATNKTASQPTAEPPQSKQRKIIWNAPDSNASRDINASASTAGDDQRKPAQSNEPTSVPSSDKSSAGDEQAAPPKLQAPTNDESAANETLTNPRIRQMLIELSRALYRESTYDDMPMRQLLMIAATTMVSPDRALQVDALNSLTDRERELLSAFQDFFISVGRDLDGSQSTEPVLTEAVSKLQRAIVHQPQLKIPTFALCTRVDGFADYKQFDPYRFLAHNGQQIVVYTEVDEFASELNDNGEWVTELSQQLTIYSDRDGIPVWQLDWQSAVDRSRSKRHDFFITQVITLPDALGVGKYNLKVRLRDEKSGAETEQSIPFEMVADPKLAADVN